MHCLRCGNCCRETEMLLANEDIERLERRGYSKEFFLQFDAAGYAKLRNRRGYCVFYDKEKKLCKVYRERPLGCRLYPVVYVETKGLKVDTLCTARNRWNKKQIEKKGQEVINLLKKIDAEAENRRAE